MTDLDLALLGPPVITRDGAPVSFDTRKATAVLALLAADHHELSRERLAALLWPDADAVRARASLRRTLSVTAAAAGPGLLVTRTAVALDPGRVRVDVTEFEALAAGPDAGPLDRAVALYRDDFLAGFALRDCPEFDDWQAATADRLRQRLAGTLDRLVAACAAAGDLDRATGARAPLAQPRPAARARAPGADQAAGLDRPAVRRAARLPRAGPDPGHRAGGAPAAGDHPAVRRRPGRGGWRPPPRGRRRPGRPGPATRGRRTGRRSRRPPRTAAARSGPTGPSWRSKRAGRPGRELHALHAGLARGGRGGPGGDGARRGRLREDPAGGGVPQDAQAAGGVVLAGRCHDGESELPFVLAADLLRTWRCRSARNCRPGCPRTRRR